VVVVELDAAGEEPVAEVEAEVELDVELVVDVVVLPPTRFVQLSLEGMAKLSESVRSAHWNKLPSPPLNSTWIVTLLPL